MMRATRLAAVFAALALASALPSAHPFDAAQDKPPPLQSAPQDPTSFKFRTGVELINVNATVTDQGGRFVPGLTREDFRVFDDDTPQTVTHFSAERVPVSLGIVLDTSGSMDGEKIVAARDALQRFLSQLLDPDDEVFLFRFDNAPQLLQGWTRDKRIVSETVQRIQPRGGTALYDAVADAVQMAQQGHNRKKAVIIISDGNDTSSHTDLFAVKQLIRETEVLVYAIGVDTSGMVSPVRRDEPVPSFARRPASFQVVQLPPRPMPFPIPGGRRPPPPPPPVNPPGPTGGGGGSGGSTWRHGGNDDRVNVAALRDITDDSGGRTEIIRYARDLDPATAGIADELSRQYYLGYSPQGARDGRWHTIRVEVKNPSYHVRSRRGYVAGK
jgi:VWFA-related protein